MRPAGAQLLVNTAGAGRGVVGVALMQPLPKVFPAGSTAMLQCTFTALADAPLGSTPVTFSDTVVPRDACDSHANSLSVTMTNGSIAIVK